MKYLRLTTTDPYYNLAVEEYLLKNSTEDIFMLWQNCPSVIIGKNQNAYAEVDLEYANEHGINIVRRMTGGGAVYHDLGNLNYSFITSTERAESLDYEYFTRPIIAAMSSLGLDCKLCGRNDIECNGKKISGNAQLSAGGRILHHGTLLFDVDTDEMSAVLRVDREKLEYKAVKSHKGRVANIASLLSEKMTAQEFIDCIETFIHAHMAVETVAVPDNVEIGALRDRNKSNDFIYSDRRFLTSYSCSRRKKFPYGIVNLDMMLNGKVIESVVISGDFFERSSVEELEKKLAGRSVSELDGIDPSEYIDKMTLKDLIELIK
jgi:lipoate-protein ligase A